MGGNGADLTGKAKMSAQKSLSASAKPPPFWSDWGKNLNKQSKNLGDGVNNWWTNMSAQTKNWKAPKWEMPVRVDVDFLNPLVLTAKKSARDFWVRLPPPVQQGLPYVAVGATTSIVVWKIQARRLMAEKITSDKLQSRVETLLEERNKLQTSVKDLKNRKIVAPQSASQLKMAAAVAEATNAAAAAATAAASAASRCSVIVRRPEK